VFGSLLYLQSRLDGTAAQFLERHGVKVEAIVNQPQIAEASEKLSKYIPGIKVNARTRTNGTTNASPAAFGSVTVKGVIGSTTAIISTDGQTEWVKTGDEFPVKSHNGSVVMRCDEVRSNLVVLSIVNSQLHKEYAVR
jgi:hypothetical protein